MQIRTRLTLQFLVIGGVIMLIASAAIYFYSARFIRDDFYNRLENKANITAKLLIEVEEIDADLLTRIEKDNPVNLPSEKIIILNYMNEILYSSDALMVIRYSDNILDRIRLSGRVTFKQDDYEVLGILYPENYDRIVVIGAATDITGLLQLRNLRLILFTVCIASLIIFFIAGWFYSGRALEPIAKVVGQVEEISSTSLDLRVNEGNGTDEIARLARTFNNVLKRLEIAFRMQKEFISNASHELRTPLTSIHGQLEVLLMKNRSVKDYKTTINSVLEDIRNLTSLSNRLLLLAHTTSEKLKVKNDHIRIDEMLWQLKDELQEFNKDYNISISIDPSITDYNQVVISGDEFLIKTAFSNIIENACKYSGNHSVEINFECSDEWVTLIFSDEGPGIPDSDIDTVFEPFYRGSNVKLIPGNGIGLSLVSRIIKSQNGFIKISSSVGEGTRVYIQLPAG